MDMSRFDVEEAAEFRREFEGKTGVVLEDAMNAFGSQFAFMIRDIKTGGMFPRARTGLPGRGRAA